MPNRILKESICTSESINQLDWFEEALFYRLIVSCDDYGRFDGRAAVIKGRLFPLKDVTLIQVSDALQKLSATGMVMLYYADGKLYLQLTSWMTHQTPRAMKSKYPEPPKTDKDMPHENDCTCKQMNSDSPVSVNDNDNNIRYPINGNADVCPDDKFERFWQAYPKYVGKAEAKKCVL